MCGRFAQAQSREEYLAHLVEAAERDIAWDPAPIGRYNVAPGTKVLLLNERDEQLHLDAVYWGYAPGWWDKPPLINARVETAQPPAGCSSRCGSTDGRSASPTAGLSGKRKEIKSSHTLSSVRMASQFLWPRLVGLRSNVGTMPKDS